MYYKKQYISFYKSSIIFNEAFDYANVDLYM